MLHRKRNPIKTGVFASAIALSGMLGTVSGSLAQLTSVMGKPAKETKTKELNLTPRAAPMPALQYRLLPLDPERTPGDAAPIYLRLVGEKTREELDELAKKSMAWLELPLDQMPTAEARKFVDGWGTQIEQLTYGARRQHCEWNYTLPEEREKSFDIQLSDVQQMRQWARLLALKARVEIAENKYKDAIRTLETGMAFSRHIAEGPFFIHTLVGIAAAHLMLDRVEELIAQPEAPNLYWSLTALPRPLIDVRQAMETEQKVLEWMIPEITELDRPRAEEEWAPLLARLYARMSEMDRKYAEKGPAGNSYGPKTTDLASFKTELLPKAREYLRARAMEGGPEAGRLSDDRAVVLYIAEKYHDIRDAWFRLQYLPYPEASVMEADTLKFVYAEKSGPMRVFVSLLPNVMGVHLSETRLDHRVAALRIVEALRMYADANGGELPKSLDQVKIVPIPLNPATGKDFVYHREGNAAVLDSTMPPLRTLGISYRITLRK